MYNFKNVAEDCIWTGRRLGGGVWILYTLNDTMAVYSPGFVDSDNIRVHVYIGTVSKNFKVVHFLHSLTSFNIRILELSSLSFH